ncbi:flagellar biosynthesis protein FlhF [Fontibacillus phaseoli]|uniref:Flagellar biosynthesis protein FlhF n=1 Tax=Fontibacillus phaseoli TaxID=1416533 RepID=A0A369BIS4_9BACL|nr:flagellar biosynthesis protein FlhF [Fontibacillus phaseoli]RCX21291.1 flagellar biosynthesis protein FlhF [Fontibacillus phaseoli]
MRVKRYIVDTMPDAMSKIRSELGADAVILSTKELKVGGFMGLFGKKKIEVIAASESSDISAAKPKPQPVRTAATPIARAAVPDAYRKSSQMVASASSSSGTEPGQAGVQPAVTATAQASRGPLQESALQEHPVVKQEREAPLAQMPSRVPTSELNYTASAKGQPDLAREETAASRWDEALRQADLNQKSPSVASTVPKEADYMKLKEERLLEELREMKSWIGQLARHQNENRELPDPLPAIKSRLEIQELSPDLIEQWLDSAYRHWIDSGKSLAEEELDLFIRSEATSFLQERVGEGIRDDTRIVYIAGPTGVGKTTTIAKLAADQIFRGHKKVGFITADTYRISAIEQLRTYSSILNVPLEVVQSPGDVQRAMQRLSHCDLILMDTAGRNYLNEIHVAELHSMLATSEQSETYLVLSLTSKSQDMKKITEHFSRYGLDKVIFTKLDETESVGPMYNLINEYPLRVSYIANGQNVPDDLLSADRELLLDLILGAKGS